MTKPRKEFFPAEKAAKQAAKRILLQLKVKNTNWLAQDAQAPSSWGWQDSSTRDAVDKNKDVDINGGEGNPKGWSSQAKATLRRVVRTAEAEDAKRQAVIDQAQAADISALKPKSRKEAKAFVSRLEF